MNMKPRGPDVSESPTGRLDVPTAPALQNMNAKDRTGADDKAGGFQPGEVVLLGAGTDSGKTKHRGLEPHIYSVDCTYRGTMVNFPDDSAESDAASRANMNAEKLVIAAMVKIGMMCFHQYSWPDGSLYKWGMFVDGSSPSPTTVADSLNRELPQNGDVYVSVAIEDSSQDPHKVGYKTVRSYAVPKNAEVIKAQNSV